MKISIKIPFNSILIEWFRTNRILNSNPSANVSNSKAAKFYAHLQNYLLELLKFCELYFKMESGILVQFQQENEPNK